jgi:hypothetical protein
VLLRPGRKREMATKPDAVLGSSGTTRDFAVLSRTAELGFSNTSFNYPSVLLSIVLGLAITQILQGFRGMILSRGVRETYRPYLLWAGLTA